MKTIDRRNLTPIAKLPLVGGALCLDFVNTNGARASARPRERLATYRDAVVFGRRTGIVTTARARTLTAAAAINPGSGQRALSRLLAVREVLYRVLLAAATHGRVESRLLSRFNTELAEAHRNRALTWKRGMPAWVWTADPANLGQLLGPILYSAAELLQSPVLSAVRKCGECDWLFIDTTRNHSRRWCKTTCGDRVKSRRYYRRRRAGESATKENSHA